LPKVFGIHIVELNEGVTAEFFERFVVEQFLPALPLKQTPGVKAYLLKADRGERQNKYVWMFEFDSIETRNRYFPAVNRISPELAKLIEPLRELSQVWTAASTRAKTDYIVLAES
jgi:hypothetical protein